MCNSTGRTPLAGGVRPSLKKAAAAICVLLILAAGFLFYYFNALLLVLLSEKGDAATIPVSPGDTWVYHYTHSVQLTPCYEYFRINGPDDMTMTHTVYESYGVGLPYSPSEGSFATRKEDGKFDLTMDRPYRTVSFRPAVQADPDISCRGKTYKLCKKFGQGVRVDVKVMKRYKYWLMD